MKYTMKGGASFALNPLFSQVKESVKSLSGSVVNKLKNPVASEGSNGRAGDFYLLLFVIAAAITLVYLLKWYAGKKNMLETPDNIRTYAGKYLQNADKAGNYTYRMTNRSSLQDYLNVLKSQGVPAGHTALTNFYFSTVNATGFFYPQIDGVYSPDAARLAVQAGARAFVFDIWPDTRPGANFMPILQIVEAPSLWRRVSLNALPFNTVLNTVVGTVFGNGINPVTRNGASDVVMIYLRFRGVPRRQTFDAVANALRDAMEQYRLDSSFYGCRGESRLWRTPITEFFTKVIISSNTRASGTLLEEYINILQKGALADNTDREWSPSSVANLTAAMQQEKIPQIQQSITFSSPLPDQKEAMSNNWNWRKAHELGIHCVGMNFFEPSDQLNEYMGPGDFGVYSYKIKPENIRYIIQMLARPGEPPNPGWGKGETAGAVQTPDPIQNV